MVICLFGQRYQDGADMKELNRISDELLEVLERIPGFVAYNIYHADDGEDLGIVRFASRKALEAWRDDPVHRATWDRATEFFSEFWIQNCDTYREYTWKDGSRRLEGDLTEVFESGSARAASFGSDLPRAPDT